MQAAQSEQLMKFLEVQGAKLYEMKNNLRQNYYKAQQDIRQTVAAMIASLREREGQLIEELDEAFFRKDEQLLNHLESVAEEQYNCNCGFPTGRSIVNVNDDVRLELDLSIADIKSLHDRISKMGKIRVSQDCQRLPVKKVGCTLPLDMELYDDDNMWLLTKKGKTASSPDTPHKVVTVKNWLSRIPYGKAALKFDLASFACDEEKSELSESNASSFELMNEIGMCPEFTANADKEFRKKIDEIQNDPPSKWLLHSDEESSCSNQLPRPPVPPSFHTDDSSYSDLNDEELGTECSTNTFKFIEVISDLQNSEDSKWLKTTPNLKVDNEDYQSLPANHIGLLQKYLH